RRSLIVSASPTIRPGRAGVSGADKPTLPEVVVIDHACIGVVPIPKSDDARDTDATVRWVPVADLDDLARALLGDLGGRDVVPQHVADRVTALAERWAAHGFTPRTVRPWTDLDPATAALLTARGVP